MNLVPEGNASLNGASYGLCCLAREIGCVYKQCKDLVGMTSIIKCFQLEWKP